MSSAFRFQDMFVRGVPDPYPFYQGGAPVYMSRDSADYDH
jgi:hypothetical protein